MTPNAADALFHKIDYECLPTDVGMEFALYLQTESAGRVMIVAKGDALDANIKDRILEAGGNLYILNEDKLVFYNYVESNLASLMEPGRLDGAKAASLAYDLSTHVMEEAFERPEAKVLSRASEVSQALGHLVTENDEALASLLKLASVDYTTYTHSCSVGLFGLGIIRQLISEGQEHDVEELSPAFFFHDLGKIDVPDEILNKNGRLTDQEFEVIKQHPDFGFTTLHKTGFLTKEAAMIVHQHHERMDGSGYPKKLKGNQIHIYGRVCAIADVFDALTSRRPYKDRMPPFEALKIMREKMSGHFDPDLLHRFIVMFKDML